MAQHAARKKTTKDLGKRIDALRSDLSALQDDTKGLASDAAGAATHRARELAENALRLAEDTASNVRDDIEAWTQENIDTAREKVREQPLSALAISLGVGALLGALFLRL